MLLQLLLVPKQTEEENVKVLNRQSDSAIVQFNTLLGTNVPKVSSDGKISRQQSVKLPVFKPPPTTTRTCHDMKVTVGRLVEQWLTEIVVKAESLRAPVDSP